ncbi:dTDP-4-amino-4,6-dideoxygalactose transaminase [Desulfonatronum thiosulfatophilum]|uniref:dTDP-4-amino-4,6-dideoxygalactose transaminase n=1 Tax=Desulfonatronum thiosulfatophilum TaxID=617002 RepID=A0A1G6AHB3_9BACT|nr:dTDP-4-amino-4,6-dideoxygalactose transaminase [Desulfonatronum thiosulfatophilum]
MQHFVLDKDILDMAVHAEEQEQGAVSSLLEMAGNDTLTLWVHPQSVTDCLMRGIASAEGGRNDSAALASRMAGLLETVRLLPAPGVQLLQILHQDTVDPLLDLTILAADEYLDEYVLVSNRQIESPLQPKTCSPEQCRLIVSDEQDARQIPFVDLKAQQQAIYPVLEANMFQVMKSCKFILGPEVEELEQRLAAYTGMEHVVSCSSGTEALVLALMAYDVGPGDAVFTTPFTFIATAEVISLLGATPIFVDIDPRTFNLDPDKLDAAISALVDGSSGHTLPGNTKGLTPRAVITVDLFGLPADHGRISAIAKKHGLALIEDAAQSFGGEEHGRRACALGDIGCTSFFPAKPLGGYGEGGACFTNNADMAEVMRSIRVHGQGTSRYEHARLGTNARLDALQAAVLLAKMDVFPLELERRHALAANYPPLLEPCDLTPPYIPEGFSSAWAQYSLLARDRDHRDACQKALADAKIPSVVYYPIPLHLQRVFQPLGYKGGDLPVCESVSRRIFSLPMHPYLQARDQERIADVLCGPGART